jgi:hypothetical protein
VTVSGDCALVSKEGHGANTLGRRCKQSDMKAMHLPPSLTGGCRQAAATPPVGLRGSKVRSHTPSLWFSRCSCSQPKRSTDTDGAARAVAGQHTAEERQL